MKTFTSLLFFFSALCLSSFGQTTSSYTSSGTFSWTCPAGITSVKVKCWGAGGAGGGVKKNGTHGGAGGAGGSFAENDNIAVTPGATYTVTVGKGGTGKTGDGADGGNSWFKSASTVLATGGQGGKADDGNPGAGSSSGCYGTIIYKGGSGQDGYNYFGTGGGGAGTSGNGGDGSTWNFNGGSGTSIGGGDGGDGISSPGEGLDGSGAGGGGSGAYTTGNTNYTGGNGADGRVDVTYYCVNYNLSGTSASSVCQGNASTITLSGSASALPAGTYTVTYNLSGANSGTGLTATMTVTAGSGTFSTATLSNSGNTTISITNLSMGSCSNAISSNNNATISVGSALSGLNYSYPSPTYCTGAAIDDNTVSAITGSGTITYSVSPSLPTGLSINSSTGTISGTPAVTSNSKTYTITASDNCSSTTKKITIKVITGVSGLSYSQQGPLIYCAGSEITANTVSSISGSGTITYSVSPSLPTGLSINSSNGKISGTPTGQVAAANYTVTASNSCSSATAVINIAVSSSLSGLTYRNSGPLTYCSGSAITENKVNTLTGGGTISYSISPSLPTGLSINSTTGTLSGTPTGQAAAANYTVTASNGCSSTTTTLNITVTAAVSGLTYTNPGPLVYCTAGTANNTVASITGSGTITYSVSPSLPAGLTLNSSTGAITGTPLTITSARNYTITASNTCGSTSTTLNISTAVAPSITATTSGSMCIGSTITLQATTISGANYLWSGPHSFSSTLQSPAFKYTSASAGTYTVAATSSTGCMSTASITLLSPAPGQWTGNSGSNWDGTGNWCDGSLPKISSDITISSSAASMPVITGNITVNNLEIDSGAFLRVSSGGIINISGAITNHGLFIDTAGTVEMSGLSAQTIPANTFFNNAVYSLVINNSSSSGVTLGGALDIYNSLTFAGKGMKLNTNDNLTIKSTANGTASVGDMTGNSIIGKVTVERYLQAKKGWRLLSVPTNTTQTIKAAWQEGCGADSNCTSGYGTQITGPAGVSGGFDAMSGSPSMKTYDPSTGAYIGVPTTNTTNIATQGGYMIFVRGDRSVITTLASSDATVLRSKGPIYTGTQSPVTVPASKFAVIGNPYPSALDMRNITKTGMKDFFYVWDPLLGGTYGYGGFQTFSSDGNGNYIVIPGGGSYGPMGSISNYIQSGQAFFMQATSSGGSVTMKESAKTSGSRLVNGMQGLPSPRLTVSLYGNPGGQSYMADGFIVDYGTQFSNSVDDMDAIKSANSSENLSDKREGSLLVVERRQPVSNTDTININMSGISAQNYYFVIDATGLSQPSLTGYLLDKFTGAKTPLQTDGSTTVNFSVTSAAGSNAANRFEIIFSAPAGILPVTFTGVSAVKDDNAVKILWDVSNETNIKGYEVQHSTDGISFITIDNKSPLANNGGAANYTTIDSDASSGMNYYRIMSTDIDGKTAYSKIVKVNIDNAANTGITAYPNPITNNTIHLRILYKPAGDYNVRLISDAGKLILRQTVSNPGGYLEHLIKVPSGASAGMYHLEVIEPGGAIHEFNLIK